MRGVARGVPGTERRGVARGVCCGCAFAGGNLQTDRSGQQTITDRQIQIQSVVRHQVQKSFKTVAMSAQMIKNRQIQIQSVVRH